MSNFYDYVMPDKMHEKLTEAVVSMIATGNLPYYGEFALFINFFESKNNPRLSTAGVNVTSSGMNFFWDRSFMERLIQSEANFLLIHEEFHLLFDHIQRSVGYDLKAANIVQDMIINQIIYDEIMKQQGLGSGTNPYITIPKDNVGNNEALFIPKDYMGLYVFENLYEWYITKRREWYEQNKDKIKDFRKSSNQCSNCGTLKDQQGQQGQGQQGQGQQGQGQQGQGQQGQGQQGQDQQDQCQGGQGGQDGQGQQGQGQQGQGQQGQNICPNCGHDHNKKESRLGEDTSGNPRYGKNGKNDVECYSLETIFEGEERGEQNTLDVHMLDEIPSELKKEIVENAMHRLKNRGLVSGNVESILNKLRKTRIDYLKEIKRAMSNHIFGSKKYKTIVRPNRRDISGLKGHKKFKNEINVILDTSGSMGGEFEKVLSYIFQNDIEINLIQCDAEVQQIIKIKEKKQLEKMRIRGLGGTTLTPAIDFISDKKNKIHMYNTVILTDGYTDSLNFINIKTKTLILSTAQKCPILHDNGKIKQIENIGKQD